MSINVLPLKYSSPNKTINKMIKNKSFLKSVSEKRRVTLIIEIKTKNHLEKTSNDSVMLKAYKKEMSDQTKKEAKKYTTGILKIGFRFSLLLL